MQKSQHFKSVTSWLEEKSQPKIIMSFNRECVLLNGKEHGIPIKTYKRTLPA